MANALVGNPQITDLTIVRNVVCEFSISWTEGGNPVSIDSAAMKLMESYEGDVILDCVSYLTVDSPVIAILIPASITGGLAVQSGVWQLEGVQTGNDSVGPTMLLRGSLSILAGMTP